MRDVKPMVHRAANFAQSWWAVFVIALLVATVLYQRWQTTHPKLPPVLQAGEHLPILKLKTLENEDISIAWNGFPTLVYIFKPDCPWCARNLKAARKLIDHAAGYRIVGLSLTSAGLREYLDKNRIRFPVYTSSGAEIGKALKVLGVPTTILISGMGEVQKVWPGAFMGPTVKEIESRFGFRFMAQELAAGP